MKDISQGEIIQQNGSVTHSEEVIMKEIKELSPMEYRDGPNQIIPTEDEVNWQRDKPVKLKLQNRGIASAVPISVPGLLMKVAEKDPNRNALARKNSSGQWQYITYRQYLADVRTVAKAFIKLGLDRFNSVCIMGFNSVEWMYSNLGAIFAGGFSAGIYKTNSPEACEHCAKDCLAQIFVVEDEKQLKKILKIQPNLPHLKNIVQYKGKPSSKGVLSWDELMAIGRKENDDELDERLKLIAINHCCSLIYTSGTTGPSKGVMLSHDNLTWTSNLVSTTLGVKEGLVMVSYLPLSHIAAQISDFYCIMHSPGLLYFADPDALSGSLVNTLREAKPTVFIGVPRVFEKMYEKMLEVGKKTTGIKKSIASWAKYVGMERSLRIQENNHELPYGYTLAKYLVFSTVRESLGFDRCKVFSSIGAPLSLELQEFFHSLNIPLCEIYGMSETTAPHSVGHRKSFKFCSAGKTMDGCETKIDNPDNDGNGEICMKGRHVFMGYLNLKEKTLDTIDKKGYIHSGDIGKVDSNGFLFITGRIKELLITAGGENVPPVLIEDELKKNLPCLSNAMLIGDGRKFLSVLLTLKTEVDEDLVPQDTFDSSCLKWLESLGCHAKTLSEFLAKEYPAVMREIQEGINKTNDNATSNAQRIQKWVILPKDFSIPGGELGPTLKLKRPVVLKQYKDTIDKFYS